MVDDPDIDAYLQPDDATALAAGVVDGSVWTAIADDADLQAAALIQASDEIDTLRFAGSRYDDFMSGVPGSQARAFPRYLPDEPAMWPAGKQCISGLTWDWDADTNAAVVPAVVKKACLLQAISILRDLHRRGRLRDRHDGVVAQGAGGVSESYDPAKPPQVVCFEAMAMLKPYLLKSGRMI